MARPTLGRRGQPYSLVSFWSSKAVAARRTVSFSVVCIVFCNNQYVGSYVLVSTAELVNRRHGGGIFSFFRACVTIELTADVFRHTFFQNDVVTLRRRVVRSGLLFGIDEAPLLRPAKDTHPGLLLLS